MGSGATKLTKAADGTYELNISDHEVSHDKCTEGVLSDKCTEADTMKKENILHLRITNRNRLKSVPDYFLSWCSTLRSIDLTQLRDITSIGYGFLFECSSLTALDLAPLSKVTSINSGFL